MKILCLEPNQLADWHNRFEGRITERGRIDRRLCEMATKQAISLLDVLKEGEYSPVRKSAIELPGYYIFANSKRAIIAAPFFLPFPPGALDRSEKEEVPSVQMLGIETTDPGLVSMARKIFDRYCEDQSANESRAAQV